MGAGRQSGFVHRGHGGLPNEVDEVFQGEPPVARDLRAGRLNRLASSLQVVDASGEHILLQGEQGRQVRHAPAEKLGDAGQRQPERLQRQHLVQALYLAWAVDAPTCLRPPRAYQTSALIQAQGPHPDAEASRSLAGT